MTESKMQTVRQATVELMEGLEKKSPSGGEGFTPKDLYQLGRVLHQLDVLQNENVMHDVQSSYHQLLQSMPQRRRMFDALHQGLQRLLLQQQQQQQQQSSSTTMPDDVLIGIEAMDSLYRFTTLAEASKQQTVQSLTLLSEYFARVAAAASKSSKRSVLSLMFRLLWKTPSHASLEWEDLLPVLETIQENGVWRHFASYLDETASGWKEAWLDGCEDEEQKEYLTTWLEMAASNPDDEAVTALANAISQTQSNQKQQPMKKTAARSAVDPLQRQIDQVRVVLPQYGEGFVELALSLRQGSVEETVALLSSPTVEWPAALSSVDPSLPRRHQKRVEDEDVEAKLRTKEALQAADRQQEQEAAILSQFLAADVTEEYNDDYDDQWDALDTAGANDGGLYDDFQAVRTYNRVVRDTEKEAAFWEASANTNRTAKPKGGGGGESSSRYRGPDKLKGGRTPKPLNSGGNNNNEKRPPANADDKGNEKTEYDNNNNNNKPSNSKGNKKPAQGNNKKPAAQQPKGGPSGAGGGGDKPSRAAQRQKDRKMANRREKQRQAMTKKAE